MTKDVIYRQAAIEALGERPLVWTDDDQYTLGERNQYDIDRLAIGTLPSAEVTLCHLGSPCEYQNADIAMPTIDAVEVVRCKDCEHRDAENGFCEGRGWPMQLVPDDGFCNKGKRRRG